MLQIIRKQLIIIILLKIILLFYPNMISKIKFLMIIAKKMKI